MAVALFGVGCGGGGGGNNGGAAKLKTKLDLSHVIGFAIAPATSPRGPATPACMPSTLYALQDDGTMAVTTVTETTGDGGSASCMTSMMNEQATSVFASPSFVLINYQNLQVNCTGNGMCDPCAYVLARKSDGALFCGADGGVTRLEGFGSTLYIQHQQALTRLDTSVDPPTATPVNDPQMESVENFEVNDANDVLASGTFGTRIFKASGGLMNLSVDRPCNNGKALWRNPADGDFYYEHQRGGGSTNYIDTIHLAAGSYASSTIGTFEGANQGYPIALTTAAQVYGWSSGDSSSTGSHLIEFLPNAAGGMCHNRGGSTPVCTTDVDCGSTATCSFDAGCGCKLCAGGERNGQMCTVDSECRDVCNGPGGVSHLLPGVTTIKNALGSGTNVFVQGTDTSGNGMIVSVDVSAIVESTCCTPLGTTCLAATECRSSDLTLTTLLAAGAYTVTATSLSNNGELTFAGLRNSDGARVIGNCVGGTCSVLNATAPMVTSLQRIN